MLAALGAHREPNRPDLFPSGQSKSEYSLPEDAELMEDENYGATVKSLPAFPQHDDETALGHSSSSGHQQRPPEMKGLSTYSAGVVGSHGGTSTGGSRSPASRTSSNPHKVSKSHKQSLQELFFSPLTRCVVEEGGACGA